MKRYVCIHGHFYQPPRENPWLEEVEQQDSAYPYHDWNERITAECYEPNTASRILDSDNAIADIVNNYAGMSFNFGPTLLSWLERHRPGVYQSILAADRESRKKFSGHGSAIAQVYNHMIMPLANSRDKQTQIAWGIRDFEHRFRRRPEGMWLAETAVDLETLDIMAASDLKFTILAPHQARRIRKIGSSEWQDVSGQKIDPKQPYLCRLPSGKRMAVFFYDGPISLDVSFRNLLNSGEGFADRLDGAFSDSSVPQLVHIATDGETYGHHHRYGEMALTYCLHHIASSGLARVTIYAEYLEMFPPAWDVEIFENSSWSCQHGVERWKADCGCNIGAGPGWHQKWRKPLRDAMDWLRDACAPLFEEGAHKLVEDPWAMRDEYIDVILNRSPDNVDAFLKRHAGRSLSNHERVHALKLLELQRQLMLMYTSCGWFFDDISGIETVQIMSYAAGAMQIARELNGVDLEPGYTDLLRRGPGNTDGLPDGAAVYRKRVRPAVTDLIRVGAHYAVSSLFKDYGESADIYCYTTRSEFYEVREAGVQRLAIGKAVVRSHITGEEVEISFAVLHLGSHNLIGGIHLFSGTDHFTTMHEEIDSAFMTSNIAEVVHLIEKHFGKSNYSLWHLFRDEQRKIINQVINDTLNERESAFTQAYKQYYPIMQVMKEMSMPLPKAFHITAEFTLNTGLRRLLETDGVELDDLQGQIDEVKRWSVEIDRKTLNFVAANKINSLMEGLRADPGNMQMLGSIIALLDMLRSIPLELNLWRAQNIYFSIGKSLSAKTGKSLPPQKRAWMDQFSRLGEFLHVKTSPVKKVP